MTAGIRFCYIHAIVPMVIHVLVLIILIVIMVLIVLIILIVIIIMGLTVLITAATIVWFVSKREIFRTPPKETCYV